MGKVYIVERLTEFSDAGIEPRLCQEPVRAG